MTSPIYLPSIGQEVGNNLNNFFTGAMQAVNPHFDQQQELKKRLAIDPDLRQKMIDEEYLNPGSIEKIYGKQVASYGQGDPSTKAMLEQFDRAHTGMSIADLSKIGTGASENAMRDFTGGTSSQYAEGVSKADQAKSSAIISEQSARVAKPAADLKIAQDEAALPNVKIIAQNEGEKVKKEIDDRGLVTSLLADKKRFSNVKDLINSAVNFDGKLSAEETSALYSDKDIGAMVRQQDTNLRLERSYALMKAKDDRSQQNQIDILNRQDSLRIATLIGKDHGTASATDIYHLNASPELRDEVDKMSSMSEDEREQHFITNPQLRGLYDTRMAYNKANKDASEKDKQADLATYSKTLDVLDKEMNQKNIPPTLINGKLVYLNTLRDKLNGMNMSLPEIRFGTEANKMGFLTAPQLYSVSPNGTMSTDRSAWSTPTIQVDNKAKAALAEKLHNDPINAGKSPAEIQAMVENYYISKQKPNK